MKRQNLNAYLSERCRQLCILKMEILFLLAVTLLLSTQLSAEDWMQLYPEIDGPVADMEFSEIPGISEYGLIFAIADSGGGLGYFDSPGNFSIFSIATNLGAVSVSADNANNRIFCAFGCGSYSDGLYEFDVNSHEFELIEWIYNPNFIKKLSSGFYFGWGNGLLYSTDGDIWTDVDYFNDKDVRDVAETSDGTLFVAAGNEICIANDTTFSSFDTYLPVNDIYVRHYPTEEVYIAIGDGSWSDGIYRVEYEDGEITGLTLINWFIYPNKIYEYDGLYEDWLVVGCLYSGGLWLVEPVEMGEIHQIGTELDFEDVYCFETYPMYCPNIMVGMDTGIYLGTNLLLTLPVYLSVFEVYWNSLDDLANIHWRTEYETDVLGFNIYRNDENDFTTAVLINFNLIPGHGTTTEPHDYYYEDEGIVPNPMDEYYYWLEVVNLGGTSNILGPINLVIPNCVLSTFVVEYLDNIPTLFWVTQSETDNIGWNIYRSINDSSFANAEMINIDLIPGQGTTSEPTNYIYPDEDVEANPGDVLWYWLESIDLGGSSYIYYPPASLVIPSGVEEWHPHAKDIVLSQNYPNPFSGSTTISFFSTKNTPVLRSSATAKGEKSTKIKIYNIKRQLIKQFIIHPDYNREKINEVMWDGKNESGKPVSSGIYLYQLSTKGESSSGGNSNNYKSEIKKMILIK
ncbi:MAG: T9SS type A sorting domain-containing protein [Candidatus Cloacimonetes bacterium]|nr:T9SS type A sorting domain-containing protein [Candidatus Cloacimonadota bacterium]